jgi:VWFA-related protein
LREFKRSIALRLVAVTVFAATSYVVSYGQTNADQVSSAPMKAAAIRYGIVVDNSGSLRMQLENIVDLVKAIVEGNGADDETFLVRFVSSDKVVLLQDFTSAKMSLLEAAEEMYIEGGQTAILDAISFSAKHLAANSKSDVSTPKVLILVTDGDDRESIAKAEQVVLQLKQLNVRVFVIGVSETLKVETKVLEKLTKSTGGKLFLPKGGAGRSTVVNEVAAAIHVK